MVRPWLPFLGDDADVVVPNVRRHLAAARSREPARPAEDGGALRTAAERLAAELPAGPFVLVGHSLGGLLAVEIAHACQTTARSLPRAVVVMASRPPGLRTAELFRPILGLNDEAFLAAMAGLGAVGPNLLSHPARTLFLRPLRADIEALCGYDPATLPGPLSMPLHAWHGSSDAIAPATMAPEWGTVAGTRFESRVVTGSHAFPDERAGLVAGWLAAIAAGRPVPSNEAL